MTVICRHLALLALLGALVPAPGTSSRVEASTLEAGHPGGAPCPDTDGDGDPCGPACPCACCPGHRAAPALACAHAPGAPATIGALEAPPQDTLNPEDVVRRVFHPPRA